MAQAPCPDVREVCMDWFGRPPAKDEVAQNKGAQALIRDLDKRVAQYLDDVDQAKLVYPACKRTRSDAEPRVMSRWSQDTSSDFSPNPLPSPKCSMPIFGSGRTTTS